MAAVDIYKDSETFTKPFVFNSDAKHTGLTYGMWRIDDARGSIVAEGYYVGKAPLKKSTQLMLDLCNLLIEGEWRDQ